MNRKFFFGIIFVLLVAIFSVEIFWAGKFFKIRWFFTPDDTWLYGAPGKVTFDIWNSNESYRAGIDTQGYLSGYFWAGKVGWGTFNYPSEEAARILCSDEVFRNPGLTCPVTGYAWLQNAGWINLSGATIDGGSGVYYNPATGHIEWFGYSAALGWVPFYADASSPITSTTQTGILLDGIGVNFIGKIAVIGNISGTRVFNMTQQNFSTIFGITNHAEILNGIRKNLALLTRNISDTDLSDELGTRTNLLVKKNQDIDGTVPGWIWPSNKKTLVTIGGDVLLSSPTVGYDTDPTRAIIALKDENGNGGNIVIGEDVKRIYGFLYAEWSIYSGEKRSGQIWSYVESGALNIPANQLYLRGALISKNTIWWALQDPSVCPVVINNCTQTGSQIYDLNYFRTYDPGDPAQWSTPYSDPRFDTASFIIDYNQSLVTDPPPGIGTLLQ